jgi:Phage terminase large subunit
MHRVRTNHFKLLSGQYVPHLAPDQDRPDGRQVYLCAQPGSGEAVLSAPETEVCHSGPRGPGKTLTALADFLQDVGVGWGAAWKGIFLRRSLTGFDDFRTMANQYIGTVFPNASFNQNRNQWTFATGETLLFRYFDEVLDFSNYQGASYTWIGFEELTQWEDDKALRMLLSCLRSPVPNIPKRVRNTTNPDGPGHTWVKRRYQSSDQFAMKDFILGPRIEKDAIGPERRMVYARLAENQVLLSSDPDYVSRIRASATDEGRFAGWVNGSWQILSGDMFGDVWADAKAYATLPPIPAQAIPYSWRIDRALDFGDAHPFSVLWFAESDGSPMRLGERALRFRPGDLVLFDEWFGEGREPNTGLRLPVPLLRDGIIQREIDMGLRLQDPATGKWTSRVRRGPADDQIFNLKPGAGGSEPVGSIADDFAEPTTLNGYRFRGITWEPANKNPGSRVQAWQQIRSRLYATIPTKDGIREKAGLFVCGNVRSFFDHVVTLPRDLKGNREDTPKEHLNDHTAAALRYRLLHNTRPAFSTRRRWVA